jgi:hypothetical protein
MPAAKEAITGLPIDVLDEAEATVIYVKLTSYAHIWLAS